MNKLNYIDISTGHIKEENAKLILETKGSIFNEISLYGYPYKVGTFLTIGECDLDALSKLYSQGYNDIVTILRYCIKNEIYLIRFDSDGLFIDDLFQLYEW